MVRLGGCHNAADPSVTSEPLIVSGPLVGVAGADAATYTRAYRPLGPKEHTAPKIVKGAICNRCRDGLDGSGGAGRAGANRAKRRAARPLHET